MAIKCVSRFLETFEVCNHQKQQLQVCKLLVELGASLDVADDNAQKAIHLAAQADQVKKIWTFIINSITLNSSILELKSHPAYPSHRSTSRRYNFSPVEGFLSTLQTSPSRITQLVACPPLPVSGEWNHFRPSYRRDNSPLHTCTPLKGKLPLA